MDSVRIMRMLLLLVVFLSCSIPVRADDDSRPVVFRTQTMGTWGSVTLVTTDSASVSDIAYDALVVFHRVDSLMSNWTDTSEIARLNREAAKNTVTVQPEVAEVIDYALRVSRDSEGAFDITIEPLVSLWGFIGGPPRVPDQAAIDQVLRFVGFEKVSFDAEQQSLGYAEDGVGIDFGGIAKGYAADRAAAALRDAGVGNALVNLSGNMVALGNAPGRQGWTVGIRDPSGADTYVARLRLYDDAVATSGDYEQFVDADGQRYGHILDPRSGWSAHGFSSVTVVADRAMTADAWATALFVLGPGRAQEIAASRDDVAAVLIEPQPDGTHVVWIESELRARIELADALLDSHTIRTF